jgi:hypothetical protein
MSGSPSGAFVRFKALDWKLKLALGLAISVALLLGLTALLNSINYSVGFRTGILNRLSRKGVACWTTEGELALSSFVRSDNLRSRDRTVENTFYFSVPDTGVRKQLEAIPPGSAVTLEYHQKLFALDLPIPLLCVRRSDYEIVGVELAPAYRSNAPVPPRP